MQGIYDLLIRYFTFLGMFMRFPFTRILIEESLCPFCRKKTVTYRPQCSARMPWRVCDHFCDSG